MKIFSYNKILIAFICIGLIAALVIGVERHKVEVANNQVDLVVNYEGLLELAEREGQAPEKVLKDAKEAGITSLAVYETTFKKLNANGKATAIAGASLIENYHSGSLVDPAWRSLVESGEIKGNEVYVIGHDKNTYAEVKEDLFRRLGADRVKVLMAGSEEVLAVKAHYESFVKMNIGMPTDEMRAVNEAGFHVVARPSNYEDCSPDDVRAVFKRLDGIDISEIVFSGNQSLGTTKSLQTTIDEMKERGITLGLIEAVSQLQFYNQDGMKEIAKGLGYDKVARLYSSPAGEQPGLKIAEAVERWANTDQERNIRIDLLHIYEKPSPDMSLYETNMLYFSSTRDLLLEKGFTLGKAGTFADYYPSKFLRALVMLGVAAGGVLYLSLIVPPLNRRPKYQYVLFAIAAILFVVPVLMGAGNKIRVVTALISANVFPALAVTWQLDRLLRQKAEDRGIIKLIVTGFVALLATGALSLVGAAYLSGALSDVEYFLEFNIFRGIKLTFVMPLVLVAIAFLQRFDIFDGKMPEGAGVIAQLKEIMDAKVSFKALAALGVVALAGIVFIARSGHGTGMPVPGIELKFRAFLEQAMYARPRSKELLIGHPAFMLAFMAFWRKWPTMLLFALVIAATIGQGSMVETFAHMRTPVFMSLMRGIGGIVLGGFIGAFCMVLLEAALSVFRAAKERMTDS